MGLDFLDSAPLRLDFTTLAAAAPEQVYRALADDVAGWTRWFGAVTLARPLETEGRGGREVRLVGGARFLETVVAAEAPRRYAYRGDVTNVPGLRALLEDWRLYPAGRGTVVRWTFAADLPGPVRLAVGLGRPGMGHAFRAAVRSLDRRLAAIRGGAG
ncbi:SRPBCC family protein [Streptomyces stramineus]|uniref:SRPBCC family protein n=1 Tax=Streptomyces stramineus TaxID=173861 RepID=A0ABN1BHC4_9ACTN